MLTQKCAPIGWTPLLLGCLWLSACGGAAPEQARSLASRIELAAGNVAVRQPGSDWTPALAGLLLRHGSTVKVGPGDRALIRLDDGSGVFLRHGTEITLKPDGLALVAGEIWVDAPPREKQPARYTAGNVAISASDAGLDVRAANGQVDVYVARGLAVAAGPGGRTEIQAGERAAIGGGKPPVVTPIAFWEDWTGGMADRRVAAGSGGTAAGRIYALDRTRPGSPPQELEVRAQNVSVTIRDGVARTTVDQRFFNPASMAVEGYYWFTIPEGAAVDRFALDTNGALVDGEVVERKQAHESYEASIRQAVDPALLEWIDGRTFRARIFPIPAAGERRVVLSYLELLPTVERRTHYIYPMGGSTLEIQEFSLEVDLGPAGTSMQIATTADARVEDGGRKVTVRRSGYKPQGDFLLEMTTQDAAPLRAVQVESARGEADYVMVRYTPDASWQEMKQIQGYVVIVVDTSAGGDDADRQLRADVAEAILRGLSTADRFALMAVDLKPRVLYPARGLAPADEANIGQALEQLSSVRPGGATDLGAVFDAALQRVHGAAQPAVVYIGDGLATVGELAGDALAARVTRSVADASSRLFTIAVGSDANHALLARLSRIGGGIALRVDLAEQAVQEALRFVGQLKTPTITGLQLGLGAGLDQEFTSAAGKVSRGEEVTVLARTHHPLPEKVRVTGELGGKAFAKTYELHARNGAEYSFVPTLWTRRYLTHLLGADAQKNRGTIIRLGLDYALMTPFTSFLVLENDEAYQRMGIPRRPKDPLWGLAPRAMLEALTAAPLALFGCSKEAPPYESRSAPRVAHETTRAPAPALQGPAAPSEAAPAGSAALAASPSIVATRARRGGHADALEEKPREPDRESSEVTAEPQPRVDVCSDASRRSLAHRRAIWLSQLDQAGGVSGWLGVFRAAESHCELPHWRDRRELLDLIQQRLTAPPEVATLLSMLSDQKSQDFVRRQLLRRAVTPDLADAATLSDTVNWALADAALARQADPARRIAELSKLCTEHRSSAGCVQRLVQALFRAGRPQEALPVALRLREDGQATPTLMREIGDLLAAAGRDDEAIRAYSEIVEFSGANVAARQLLGDIYLRHGWYDLAYRQFRTLNEARPDDPAAALRLAAAAAGTGRVDEALRIERKIAGGEGEPGPTDPRRWARLWSAARIARLMLSTIKGGESTRQSMERTLRRLQVLGMPGVLVLLTWEDLDARLGMTVAVGGHDVSTMDRIDAAATGLYALSIPAQQVPGLSASITLAGGTTDRPIKYEVTAIRWDGQKLALATRPGKLAAATSTVSLELPAR